MDTWHSGGVLLSHWKEAAEICACGMFTAVLAASLWASSKKRRRFGLDEAGGLAEELVLGFPFFVLFLAVTIQLILMMHARIVVNYAAFVAARSASVWVPACYNGENSNAVRLSSQAPSQGTQLISLNQGSLSKLDRIRSAAVLACAPISPNYLSWLSSYTGHIEITGLPDRISFDRLNGSYQTALRDADTAFSRDLGLGQPGRLLPRWFYSSIFTEVTFDGSEQASEITFPPNGDIKITVEHKFSAEVPFVGRILGHKYTDLLESRTDGLLTSDTYYIPIRESYTIHNEGERLYPGYETCAR